MGWLRARTWARPLAAGVAAAAAFGMFVVLVMGATVTSTGSAQGCGRDWPLCRGKFIPDFAVATAIEFSHRAVTGIEGLLIVAAAVLVSAVWWQRRSVRVLVPLMVVFLLLQAGMGAWAVKYPQAPVVLALHFGISLIALAATALLAIRLGSIDAPPPPRLAPILRWATWAAAIYLYVLVYSGAYIRHIGAAAACTTWPLCTGSYGSLANVLVDDLHRFLAVLAAIVVAALLAAYRLLVPARRDLAAGGIALLGLLLLQGLAGGYLVLSGFSLIAELTHAGVTGLVFVAAAYLVMQVQLGDAAETPAGPGRAEGAIGGERDAHVLVAEPQLDRARR